MSEPVGVAILGAAHTTHAWSYARALSATPGARLVGVHDEDEALAQWLRADFGAVFHHEAAELVAAPEVQAVVVTGTTATHRSSVELAASLGRHVLCEKPLATTVADAEAILAACGAAGVQLHLAFVSRFLPVVARAREVVRGGGLGEVLGMVGGNRGRPPLPPAYPPWITSLEEAGGGALMDHSVHVTDVMRHVSGLEVATVSAETGSLIWDCGVDDVAVLSLAFENGAVGSVDSSWSVPRDDPSDYDFYLRILGTEGSLDLTDSAASLQVVSSRDDGPRGLRLSSFAEDADLAMIEAFVASVGTGHMVEPCATGEEGLKALTIALAGYESSRTASPVRLT